ncbi:MAG: trehalose-phosphatase, partial [Myxococcota bacterium]|nr:trehalose-phosphatase [Myxococcota bacterium]
MQAGQEIASSDRIRDIAGAPVLGVLVDLDGTLIPIAQTPGQAQTDEEVARVLVELAQARRTRVVVISGRPRASLEAQVGAVPGVWLVAEHGAWRRDDAGWHALPLIGTPPDGIERTLAALASSHPGAFVERKTWSVCLHYRRVRASSREALVVESLSAMHAWIAEHPEYELLDADAALEVRHRGAHKGSAVSWLRERLGPGARLIALGDDFTDEDTFAAMSASDASILVGPRDRPTHADRRLESPADVRAFLRWVARVRSPDAGPAPERLPRPR